MPSIFNSNPDYHRILAVLKGDKPDRVPLYEFFSDPYIQKFALDGYELKADLKLSDDEGYNLQIIGQYFLGYDYISCRCDYNFPQRIKTYTKDSEGNDRYFNDDKNAPIKTRKDFEETQFPTLSDVSFENVERAVAFMPDGMKVICNLGGGVLEWGMWLMGAENFCITVYDDPEFISNLLDTIVNHQVNVARKAASYPDIIACAMGDDYGFKTQTFLPPNKMRDLILPRLKKIVDVVHEQGKLFILHTCGNVIEIMNDLIDFVKVDAKHSFEDVIMPVDKAYEIWGSKVSLLGGVDIDFLTRANEYELRKRVKELLRKCGTKGRYAMGSGNSIANYIPPSSLRIMCEETVKSEF